MLVKTNDVIALRGTLRERLKVFGGRVVSTCPDNSPEIRCARS